LQPFLWVFHTVTPVYARLTPCPAECYNLAVIGSAGTGQSDQAKRFFDFRRRLKNTASRFVFSKQSTILLG